MLDVYKTGTLVCKYRNHPGVETLRKFIDSSSIEVPARVHLRGGDRDLSGDQGFLGTSAEQVATSIIIY